MEATQDHASPKLTAGAMAVAGIILLLIVGGIITSIGRLLKWLEEIAMSVGDAFLLILQWAFVGTLSVFVLLALIDVTQLLLRGPRKWAKRRQAMQSCPRPTLGALLGQPCSPLDQILANMVEPALESWGLEPEKVTEPAMPTVRACLPACFARSANEAHFHSEVSLPLFEILQRGCPELERRVTLSCPPYRKAMWLVRRAWNRLTFGKLGLSKEASFSRDDPEEIMRDLARFKSWVLDNIWSMLPGVEQVLWPQLEGSEARVLQEPPPKVSASRRPSPRRASSATPPQVRPALPQVIDLDSRREQRQAKEAEIQESAREMVREIEDLLQESLPWLDPEALLAQLLDPLEALVAEHPELAQAQTLLTTLIAMQAALPQAWAWIRAHLARPSDQWPVLLEDAFTLASQGEGEVTEGAVIGHALRLYLSSGHAGRSKDWGGDPGSASTSPDPEREPDLETEDEPSDERDQAERPEPTVDPDEPDTQDTTSEAPPSPTQRAEALF